MEKIAKLQHPEIIKKHALARRVQYIRGTKEYKYLEMAFDMYDLNDDMEDKALELGRESEGPSYLFDESVVSDAYFLAHYDSASKDMKKFFSNGLTQSECHDIEIVQTLTPIQTAIKRPQT